MNAIDTNVFVYSFDADEPSTRAKALDLFDRLTKEPIRTLLMWQVAGELLSQLRRWETQKRMTALSAESAFSRVRMTFPLQIPTDSIFGISFHLRSRFSLSHWDAMLLAACKGAGVTTLYSEDLAAGTDYDGVMVVNPFV